MEKVYVCIQYNFVTDISKFAAAKETKFEGDKGLVHLQSLNLKDTIEIKGKASIGTVKVAKIAF